MESRRSGAETGRHCRWRRRYSLSLPTYAARGSSQSPTLRSIISRTMSACPACRLVSRITCRYTHRNVSFPPWRRVVEAVLGGDRSGAVALRLVGTDDIVQLLVRLQPQVGLRVCVGPRRCGQFRGGDLPDLLSERSQLHPTQVFDQAAEAGAARHWAAPGVLFREAAGLCARQRRADSPGRSQAARARWRRLRCRGSHSVSSWAE